MLHVGLDLSRKRVDVCVICNEAELVEHFRTPCDRDGLYGLTRRLAVHGEPIRAVVESMNGSRYVRDELVRYGWEVLVADVRIKGLAPLACKTDKVDARVLAELSFRDLVPAIWLPTPELRAEREHSRWRLHLVKHRAILKNRVHSSLIAYGHRVPMADLLGVAGRRLLASLDFPEPWLGAREGQPGADRRSRPPDRRDRELAAALRCRSPLPAAAVDLPGDRVDHRLHDRGRDRRHQPPRLTGQADRLHRPVLAREPVR
jgi:Transposase